MEKRLANNSLQVLCYYVKIAILEQLLKEVNPNWNNAVILPLLMNMELDPYSLQKERKLNRASENLSKPIKIMLNDINKNPSEKSRFRIDVLTSNPKNIDYFRKRVAKYNKWFIDQGIL